MELSMKAYAKINLTLDVIGKRSDGYHELRTIMQTISLYDTVSIKKNVSGIKVKTNLAYLPRDNNNIAYKAAELFFAHQKIDNFGIEINIKKSIPVAAGLAGGSSDAAATLILLNKMFETNLSLEQLAKLGKAIGADVPYCIHGGTALAEGIGEKLTFLKPIPKVNILIAKPPINVSTAYVYGKLNLSKILFHPDTDGVLKAIDVENLIGISKRLYNVLEEVTAKEYPVIEEYKSIMTDNGALGSIMSGSGPTVFGIFDNEENAKRAYNLFLGRENEAYLTESI